MKCEGSCSSNGSIDLDAEIINTFGRLLLQVSAKAAQQEQRYRELGLTLNDVCKELHELKKNRVI